MSRATIVVLYEPDDGSACYYRTWRGVSNVQTFKRMRRAEAPQCRVSFGRALWQNSYGAH